MAYDVFFDSANQVSEGTTAEPGVSVEISGLRIHGNPDIGTNGSVELTGSILQPADQRLATNADAGVKLENDGQSFDPFV